MASHIPIWLIGFSLLSFNSLAQTVIAPTYEALTNAAASGGNFQFSGPGTIVIPSPVAFSSTTTLDGNGHQVLLSGNSQSSIIQLGTNTALTLKGLSFVNGRAEGSAAPGNVRPGNGGAIVNLGGSLTIQSCTFSNNIAKGAPNPPGGPVGDGPLPVDPPACNAAGGAIWQLGGSLVIEDTSFLTNSAASTLASPGEANGGAIYIKDADEFQLSNVKFTNNTVALQSGGSFSAGHFESVPARGGAVYSENTDLTFAGGELINSTAANHTGPSYGGGIFATNATVVVSELLASNNFALGGTIGDRVANRGMPALGGALHVIGTTRISNSAFLTNSVRGGLARFTPPATGRGGAIYSQGELSIVNTTAFANRADTVFVNIFGQTEIGGDEGAMLYAAGTAGITNSTIVGHQFGYSAIATTGGSAIAKNSLFAKNAFSSPTNFVSDAGHNLSQESWPPFTQASSTNNINPKIGPIGNYGGSTPTFPLTAGSPAIDNADDAAAPSTDQRGRTRPSGPHADIGAFESSAPFYVWSQIRGYIDPTTAVSVGTNTVAIDGNGVFILAPLSAGSHSASFTATNALFAPNPINFTVSVDGPLLDQVSSYELHSLNYTGNAQSSFILAGLAGETWNVDASLDLTTWGDVGTFTIPASGLVTIPVTNSTALFLRANQQQ